MRIRIAFSVAMLLFAVTCAHGGTAKVPDGVEFTYHDPAAFSVSLAGSFNNWDTRSNPMVKDDEGTWRVVVPLSPGKYEYKFVVNGGDWMADPENPTIVGDYGNSGLEIDGDGNPVVGQLVSLISNTPANARVMINGWFRGTYTTRKDALGDVRWRLSRPAHEMYVSFNPTIGSDVKGSVTIRIDSGEGDIREVTADLYAGRLAFESTHFGATAYHNEEIASFDDPLEVIGHEDLPGTPWEEHIDYGRGTQGVIADLRLAGAEVRTLYSNTYDDDIYNSDVRWEYDFGAGQHASRTRYDNSGTDILAGRAKRRLLWVDLGVTVLSERSGWWVGFEEGNVEDPYIEAYRDETGDYGSTWFEVGTSTWLVGGDVAIHPAEWFSLFGEIAKTSYEALWDAGNRVRIQGDQKVDGKIDAPVSDEAGTRIKSGFKAARGDHSLRFTFEQARYEGMAEDEAFVSFYALPFEDADTKLVDLYGFSLLEDSTYFRVYGKVNGIDEFVIYEHDPLPEREIDVTEVDISSKVLGFDVGLEVDVEKKVWNYTGSGPQDAKTTHLSVLPSVGGSLFGERLTFDLLYENSQENISGRMPSVFDKAEFLARGDLRITDRCGAYYNVRWADYEWADEGQGRSEGFLNSHFALVWSPIPRVELRLGYGLNPIYYIDTPVEGREIGRERWLSSYLWPRPGATLIDAERALEDLKIISLMGVISF